MVEYSLTEKEKIARSMVCLPLDGLSEKEARDRVRELSDFVGIGKVNDLFAALGPEAIRLVGSSGLECFWDSKFYDIPNTVENYAYKATMHGVLMFNVHASGGFDMLKSAMKGVDKAMADAKEQGLGIDRPRVYAVTILTSSDTARLLDTYKPLLRKNMQDIDFRKYYPVSKLMKKKWETLKPEERDLIDGMEEILDTHGVRNVIQEQVLHMAKMAHEAGLDGIVCSAAELYYVKPKMPVEFMYVTPGIESPTGKVGADQIRTFTPANAVKEGSNILVVGRAITDYKTADERRAAAYAVIQDIASVL